MVVTSGHVGSDSEGKRPADLEEEMVNAFEKVEKSILAVDPTLTALRDLGINILGDNVQRRRF